MRVTEYELLNDMDALPQLKKVRSTNYPKINKINNPACIAQMLRDLYDMDKLAEEHFYMIATNTKCTIANVFLISKGTYNMAPLCPREVLIRALAVGAQGIIITHNHPSASIKPSKEDIEVTERIYSACEMMGIKCLDHIIVAGEDFFSFLRDAEDKKKNLKVTSCVNTDKSEHTARSSSACFPAFQCTLSAT